MLENSYVREKHLQTRPVKSPNHVLFNGLTLVRLAIGNSTLVAVWWATTSPGGTSAKQPWRVYASERFFASQNHLMSVWPLSDICLTSSDYTLVDLCSRVRHEIALFHKNESRKKNLTVTFRDFRGSSGRDTSDLFLGLNPPFGLNPPLFCNIWPKIFTKSD